MILLLCLIMFVIANTNVNIRRKLHKIVILVGISCCQRVVQLIPNLIIIYRLLSIKNGQTIKKI